MKHVTNLACFLILICSVACKKGDTGPQGPSGATGATGATGPQGPAGANSNVIYSDWRAFSAAEWKDTVMTNVSRVQRAIMDAPTLTQPIIDSGIVLTYLKDVVVNNAVYQLPFTYGGAVPRTYANLLMPGKVIVYEFASNGSGGFVSTTNQFRYIIMRGNVHGRSSLNWQQMPYEEVCQRLQIPQ